MSQKPIRSSEIEQIDFRESIDYQIGRQVACLTAFPAMLSIARLTGDLPPKYEDYVKKLIITIYQ